MNKKGISSAWVDSLAEVLRSQGLSIWSKSVLEKCGDGNALSTYLFQLEGTQRKIFNTHKWCHASMRRISEISACFHCTMGVCPIQTPKFRFLFRVPHLGCLFAQNTKQAKNWATRMCAVQITRKVRSHGELLVLWNFTIKTPLEAEYSHQALDLLFLRTKHGAWRYRASCNQNFRQQFGDTRTGKAIPLKVKSTKVLLIPTKRALTTVHEMFLLRK